MEWFWDIPNRDCKLVKPKWLSKGNPEVMLHKSDLNHQEGTSLSLTLSLPVCLSTCTLFPLNELLLSLLSISMEINFYTAEEPRPCHWLLTPGGLAAMIRCSHCHGLTSVSGPEWKSYFKPLQARPPEIKCFKMTAFPIGTCLLYT